MRGSAIYFAEQLAEFAKQPDLIFTSDMTNLAELRALLPEPWQPVPAVCYFHENQLTYPLPDESQRDYQYGFTNITSCLAADEVWFNSNYHYRSFVDAADGLFRKMPDYLPRQAVQRIREKSRVMPLGLAGELFRGERVGGRRHPPTVLWNHRWEYDKNPDEFFEVLFDLDRAGVDFRLIVAGENFREAPPIFSAARQVLAGKIVHFGYASDYREYLRLLGQADIVASTSVHEFFGLSVLEAIAAGCYPLLPGRLSYPELIPSVLHGQHLYRDRADLAGKLTGLLQNGVSPLSAILTETVEQYRWEKVVVRYDEEFERVAKVQSK